MPSVCKSPGCKKHPSFGPRGTKTRLHCGTHRAPDDINQTHRQCVEDGCTKFASFSIPGERSASICRVHRQDGMTLVGGCHEPGCQTFPSYITPDRKTRLCVKHTRPGMTRINSTKKVSGGATCASATPNESKSWAESESESESESWAESESGTDSGTDSGEGGESWRESESCCESESETESVFGRESGSEKDHVRLYYCVFQYILIFFLLCKFGVCMVCASRLV